MLLARKPEKGYVTEVLGNLKGGEFTYAQVGATYNKKGRNDFLTDGKQQQPNAPQKTSSTPALDSGFAASFEQNGKKLTNGQKTDSLADLSTYWLDHYRVELGKGEECYHAAVKAIQSWQMFAMPWVELCYPETPIEVGSVVGILARNFGFWSLNACRIVYVMDHECEEDGTWQRYGFAYGTLSQHVEKGEERFMVEWNREDDTVWYDLLSFSRPQHWLLKAGGFPVGRYFQRCFARDSMNAMVDFVAKNTTKHV